MHINLIQILMQMPDLSTYFPVTDPTWIFFLVLSIILFAPILLGKLKIPHIVGMILAGVLIGPYGLHVLDKDSSFELFGNVGLYYIMFLASLEMDMQHMKRIRWQALTLGLAAFVFPLTMGVVSNVFLLKYSLVTSVLLASMYASHTLIAYPIVIRYGVSRNRSVSIAVGGTIVTDTLTLLVLAFISGMFREEVHGGWFGVVLLLKVILLSLFIVYSFPRIARWFFRRYNDPVIQFIFVLAMVFLSAGLMELIGMEGILGAFLAGLVLNRLIPHSAPLMHHLEFVGNALFIPYFLIGVGMIIDLRVLFGSGDALKVAAVMITMALAGKWIASWVTLSTPEERRSDAYSPGELSSAYRLWSALSLVRIYASFIRSEATAALSIALMPFSATLVLMPLPIGFTSFPGRARPYSSSSFATTTIRPFVREYSQVERVMSWSPYFAVTPVS